MSDLPERARATYRVMKDGPPPRVTLTILLILADRVEELERALEIAEPYLEASLKYRKALEDAQNAYVQEPDIAKSQWLMANIINKALEDES